VGEREDHGTRGERAVRLIAHTWVNN